MTAKPRRVTNESRSLRQWRKEGWEAITSTYWLTYFDKRKGKRAMLRKDLMGFADILAWHPRMRVTAAIQTTTREHLTERKNKILQSQYAASWLAAGNRIFVDGWFSQAGQAPGGIRYDFVRVEITI